MNIEQHKRDLTRAIGFDVQTPGQKRGYSFKRLPREQCVLSLFTPILCALVSLGHSLAAFPGRVSFLPSATPDQAPANFGRGGGREFRRGRIYYMDYCSEKILQIGNIEFLSGFGCTLRIGLLVQTAIKMLQGVYLNISPLIDRLQSLLKKNLKKGPRFG